MTNPHLDGPDDMDEGEQLRQARLDALAGTRSVLRGDLDGAAVIVDTSKDVCGLARAAIGFTAALLGLMPEQQRERILDGLVEAAAGPDGARP